MLAESIFSADIRKARKIGKVNLYHRSILTDMMRLSMVALPDYSPGSEDNDPTWYYSVWTTLGDIAESVPDLVGAPSQWDAAIPADSPHYGKSGVWSYMNRHRSISGEFVSLEDMLTHLSKLNALADVELDAKDLISDVDLDQAVPYTDYDGNKLRSIYLGSVFSLAPSGKYWTWFAASNVDEWEMERDSAYMDSLESAASERGAWIESGEGDPCDLYLVMFDDDQDENQWRSILFNANP